MKDEDTEIVSLTRGPNRYNATPPPCASPSFDSSVLSITSPVQSKDKFVTVEATDKHATFMRGPAGRDAPQAMWARLTRTGSADGDKCAASGAEDRQGAVVSDSANVPNEVT